MLAHQTDEPPTTCERAPLDVIAVALTPDDRGTWAQVAYEAARHLEAERWIPARRRRSGACRSELRAWRRPSAVSSPRGARVADNGYDNVDRNVYTDRGNMAQTTTVRVHPHTRQAIAELSAQRGTTAADLLEELVARERDNALLEAMNQHFATLRDDDRRALADEREAWDRTLLDGLTRSS
jgi:hypothetical protein